MVESLRQYLAPPEKIVILALDFSTERHLKERFLADPVIEIKTFVDFPDVDFWSLRSSRSYVEFCWALGSVLSNELLKTYKSTTTYLDADICFFSSPSDIQMEAAKASASITPHRFPSRLKSLEVNGLFNVGWVSFAPTAEGLEVSSNWRKNCEQSTAYEASVGIVGDQKYLDEWPRVFNNVYQIPNPGVNLAPWNHESYKVTKNKNRWSVDGDNLIFYHFHGFRTRADGLVYPVADLYRLKKDVPRDLYLEYFNLLKNVELSLGPWHVAPRGRRMKFKWRFMLFFKAFNIRQKHK